MDNDRKNRQAVIDLDASTVGRVYSGKPGCGCGCNGNYYEDQRNITRVVNLMKKRADADWRRVGVNELHLGAGDFAAVAFVEDDTRYLWAYLNKEDA